MRKFYPFIFLFLLPACTKLPLIDTSSPTLIACEALEDAPISESDDEFPVKCCLEPGLDAQTWKAFLEKNLVIDSLMADTIPAGTYKVMLQFELEPNGSIVNAIVIDDPGHGLGQFALNVIKRYKEKSFSEEYPFGKSYHKQPITFVFEEEEENCNEESTEPSPMNLLL